MSQATLSVVICAYTTERWERLQTAVMSVLDQSHRAHEVLVVVDHCDELERLARQDLTLLGVRVVPNATTRGLSGARNTGMSHTTGEVVVFLDDDAQAAPGWLAAHARHYDDPDVLGVGGLVVPHWEDAAPLWFPPEFGWVVGCSYVGLPTTTAEIRNPIGANMSFRRSVLEAVGGFSVSLGRVGSVPRGCEETEVSIRSAAAFPHGRILHEPSAVVRHHVPMSRAHWAYFRRRCWSEGRSKADLSRLTDPRRALDRERSYVTRTLPAALRRDVGAAGRAREAAYLLRVAAVGGGVAITVAGYVTGQVSHALGALRLVPARSG